MNTTSSLWNPPTGMPLTVLEGNDEARVGDNEALIIKGCGDATAGRDGYAKTGANGWATAGNGGTAIVGDYGCAEAGIGGMAAAGIDGAIIIRSRRGHLVSGTSEDGILPNVLYRLNDDGKFVSAEVV